ncbi:MAG: acyltransferase, partial [Flavobacteriales bacterium]|nr:acyltransferase [Flavobacteriales bacterium]
MIYFKGLNGIRAIASIIVVIWHIAQFHQLLHIPEFSFYKNGMSKNAVDMFFVLSGFLITYLLLIEKEKTNTINLKKFYLRRIFRIWPLYYLALFLSLILVYFKIVPSPSNLTTSIFLYLFLMANVAYALKFIIQSVAPLWSVGVEEQFYLIWPIIIKKTNSYLLVFSSIIIGYLILKLVMYFEFTPKSKYYNLVEITKIDIMCMGAIGAYLVYSKSKLLKLIYRKEVELLSWGVLAYGILFNPIHVFSFIDAEINAAFYLILILNVATNKNAIISLENKPFNFLGRISYGIYIYHIIIIYSLAALLNHFQLTFNFIIIFFVIIVLTITIAYFSYKYFETPFLKMK